MSTTHDHHSLTFLTGASKVISLSWQSLPQVDYFSGVLQRANYSQRTGGSLPFPQNGTRGLAVIPELFSRLSVIRFSPALVQCPRHNHSQCLLCQKRSLVPEFAGCPLPAWHHGDHVTCSPRCLTVPLLSGPRLGQPLANASVNTHSLGNERQSFSLALIIIGPWSRACHQLVLGKLQENALLF